MILCVDTHRLNTAPYVQKDVNLEDILLNHTKYYDTPAEAEKDFYVPLSFSVSVRSVYTNKVLQIEEEGKYQYYVNHAKVGQFVHKGLDLIMYLSAIGLMTYVKYSPEFDVAMMKYSTHQPIGLYNPDHGFFDPIICSHVILQDEGINQFKTFLKPGVEFVSIKTMNTRKEGNLTALLDTLIEVKGDSEK